MTPFQLNDEILSQFKSDIEHRQQSHAPLESLTSGKIGDVNQGLEGLQAIYGEERVAGE